MRRSTRRAVWPQVRPEPASPRAACGSRWGGLRPGPPPPSSPANCGPGPGSVTSTSASDRVLQSRPRVHGDGSRDSSSLGNAPATGAHRCAEARPQQRSAAPGSGHRRPLIRRRGAWGSRAGWRPQVAVRSGLPQDASESQRGVVTSPRGGWTTGRNPATWAEHVVTAVPRGLRRCCGFLAKNAPPRSPPGKTSANPNRTFCGVTEPSSPEGPSSGGSSSEGLPSPQEATETLHRLHVLPGLAGPGGGH